MAELELIEVRHIKLKFFGIFEVEVEKKKVVHVFNIKALINESEWSNVGVF